MKKRYRILISKFIWFISKYCELFTFSWAGPRSDSIYKRISIQRLFWLQLWSWNKWLVNLWNFHIKFESETWASLKSSLKQQRKSWKKAQQVFIKSSRINGLRLANKQTDYIASQQIDNRICSSKCFHEDLY